VNDVRNAAALEPAVMAVASCGPAELGAARLPESQGGAQLIQEPADALFGSAVDRRQH
jgi:hypothetical protein